MRNRYVLFTGVKRVEVLEETLGAPPSGAALVRSEFTFISAGTELANLTGADPQVFRPGSWCAYPWRPGYAQVGLVEAVGEGFRAAAPGQRVFTLGGHADYARVTGQDLVLPVPDGLDPLDAVASRMAGVAAAAIVAKPPAWYERGWVAVYGLGMVGNLAAQCYRALGARVIGLDPLESRRALARTCGIAHTVAAGPGAADALDEITHGQRPHIVVDATGRGEVVLEAVARVGNHGHVILLGTPRVPLAGDLTSLLSAIHLRNLTVHGALEWSLPAAQPAGFNNPVTRPVPNLSDKQGLVFDWIRDGRLAIRPLISHVVRPDKVAEAYAGLLEQPEAYTGAAIDWQERS
ncbi:MAG: Alcohol dehydrogenase [Lentisphaerae bacterium ADurb.BinA184]|nr:MAG: Alcohol dehydrogenase [Lentisphaerae bacterium ADurb.BinA184]